MIEKKECFGNIKKQFLKLSWRDVEFMLCPKKKKEFLSLKCLNYDYNFLDKFSLYKLCCSA